MFVSRASLVLSERVRRTQGQSQPLTWLNLLCLDAPLVALAWQQLFARAVAVPVSTAACVALFATAWLIYLVDRIADSWALANTELVSRRQRFAQQNRTFFSAAVVIALLADAVAIPKLDHTTFVAGAIIGLMLGIYLALNRFVSSLWRIVPVKELAIGTLFAAGVFASLDAHPLVPLKLASTFAVLCALNCVSIAFWERDLDVAQKRNSIATTFPALQRAPTIGCAVLALVALRVSRAVPFICIAVSAALLSILNLRRLKIGRDTRSALADVVLLTPLIALPYVS